MSVVISHAATVNTDSGAANLKKSVTRRAIASLHLLVCVRAISANSASSFHTTQDNCGPSVKTVSVLFVARMKV